MLFCLSLIAFSSVLLVLVLAWVALELRLLRCGHINPETIKAIAKEVPERAGWDAEVAFAGRADY